MWIVVISASLVLTALWATWRDENLRWIAAMLAVSMALSNAVHFFGTEDDVPGVYTMAELFVMIAAYVAWEQHRRTLPIVLGFISAVSTTANIVLATILHPNRTQINQHEATTNILFALECLVTIGMGVAHGLETGRIHWRTGDHAGAAQSHGFRDRAQ